MPDVTTIQKRLTKLQSVLLISNIQKDNQPLYQVINQLIQALSESLGLIVIDIEDASGGGTVGGNETFLTVGDELVTLPNSSQIVAGDNMSFDTSVIGQLRLDVTIPSSDHPEWDVLTNGDPVVPELIFAGGDVIMTHMP